MSPDAGGASTVTVEPWSTLTATTLDHATELGDGSLVPREGFGNTMPTAPEYTDANGGRDVLDTDASGNTNGIVDDNVLYADDFDYAEAPAIKAYDPATGELSPSPDSFLESRGGKDKPAGTPTVQVEDNGVIPRYTNDTNGAFESVATEDATRDRVLRQQVGPGMAGSAWNGGDPKTTIGDFRWANYRVSVDAFIGDTAGAYATVGAREQGGTANGQSVSAAELRINAAGAWTFMRYGSTVASGTTAAQPATNFQAGNAWNNLAVQVAGTAYTAYVNGVQVASYTDPAPQAAGRIQLGSGFTFTQFDNLVVERVPGYTPYYTTVIDGMHQVSWEDRSEPVLRFDEQWTHVNGQGMFEWQRTASNSTGKGAALTYTFNGTGLDLIGSNNGNARLDVTVDGVLVAAGARTWAAGTERTTFTLRGLGDGPHTVVLETATSDPINVDAVGVVVANADSAAVSTTGLVEALTQVAGLQEEDWSPVSWAPFADIRGDAESAVADPATFGLDAEGVVALAARLTTASAQLVPKDVSPDVRDLGALAVPVGETLPGTVLLDGVDTAMTWDSGAADAVAATAPLGSVIVTGRTTERQPATDLYQRISVRALVVPNELEYFIDTGAADSGSGSVYAAVKGAQTTLRNDSTDQKWDGTAPGKSWGYSTASTSGAVPGSATDWSSSYVAANFNQPIVYHLTLPAGSYTIVGVQAPRAGLTTNVYSSVTAGGSTTRVNAVSTGAATPVSQQLTLTETTVVDVEFGTNGTSGYNARLALVYVQAVPRDLGFRGALTVTDALPTTVTIDGSDVAVTWDDGAEHLARTEYAPLTVTGTAGSGANSQRVVARYEVIPQELVYYIDSGTGGADSPQYSAVKNATPALQLRFSRRSDA